MAELRIIAPAIGRSICCSSTRPSTTRSTSTSRTASATYLFDLAQDFTAFYEACPSCTQMDELRASRLTLADLTARVLATGPRAPRHRLAAADVTCRRCRSTCCPTPPSVRARRRAVHRRRPRRGSPPSTGLPLFVYDEAAPASNRCREAVDVFGPSRRRLHGEGVPVHRHGPSRV